MRVPGADLGRLPIRLDLGGISLLEGIRTTIAAGIALFADTWLASDLLVVFGVAALVVCFADTGGPINQRIRPLIVLSVLGAVAWGLFGVLRGLGLAYVLPAFAVCVFANSMARVWGLPGQSVGNVLTVVIVLALDAPLEPAEALQVSGVFVAGGAWAVLLTILVMGIRPHRPATEAVSDVWLLLSDLAADLIVLLRQQGGTPEQDEWEAHARVHRRAVREAIERARIAVGASLRIRGPSSPQAMANLLRLDMGERLFGALIALSNQIEHTTDPAVLRGSQRLLRRLRPLLKRIGGTADGDLSQFAERIDRLDGDDGSPAIVAHLATSIAELMRAALRLKHDGDLPNVALADSLPATAEGSLWEALRSNLNWDSAILRHAVRVTVVTVPAMAISLMFWTPYSHWLAYSASLTMQPFFSATWQRVLERTGGTVVGAALGGALAFLPHTPMVHALVLLPLCVIGFSARQVSYGAFIACMTPLVVLLFDIVVPGQSDWTIAVMRIAYTIAGGAIALIAGMVLWPSWEPHRVREELRSALLAHAAFARSVFSGPAGLDTKAERDQTRRAAGVAINNLEASLSRALQEPLRGQRDMVRKALLADGALRRMGACLMLLEHAPAPSTPDRESWDNWAKWLPEALVAVAQGDTDSDSVPALPEADDTVRDAIARIRRHVEILHTTAGAIQA